ncbi:MAG TPA: sugar ABC transporter permease [Trebonia sp.]|jgi:multiple sugar transport system permease protein|nr:sugar ABC transporter permease [Trebonia sp.]
MSASTIEQPGPRPRAGLARASLRPRRLEPVLWLGPAVALIAVVVIWPIVAMIQTSLRNITPLGIDVGPAGWSNFSQVFDNPNLPGILVRTLIWVIAVVAVTMSLSFGLAQLLNQRFPGRRYVRWALIAPWAASVMMTALIFRWMLQPDSGVIYLLLHQLGLVSTFSTNTPDWLGNPDAAMAAMMAVAVFVSLPFTTYVLLAGLQSIPGDLYEAARVDGASPLYAYRHITLPLLRPAFAVGTVINLMNVFNSFPIIWEMTRGGPGYETATSTVFMYDLKGTFVGQAAAMSIVNFALVVIITIVFLRVNAANQRSIR